MREIRSRETDDEYARLWTLADADRVLFVTHLTPDSATRYQFSIENEQTGRVTITQSNETTPPRVVVELLNEADFTVGNLPNVEETDPSVQSESLIDAIKWLSKHGGFDSKALRQSAYQRSQNALAVVIGSNIICECVGADRYCASLRGVLANNFYNGNQLTREELLTPRRTNITFLQKLLIGLRESLSPAEQQQIWEMYTGHHGVVPAKDADSDGLSHLVSSNATIESEMRIPAEALDQLAEDGWMDDSFR